MSQRKMAFEELIFDTLYTLIGTVHERYLQMTKLVLPIAPVSFFIFNAWEIGRREREKKLNRPSDEVSNGRIDDGWIHVA